jgi:gluconate 2-dehydrogenase gamma chain
VARYRWPNQIGEEAMSAIGRRALLQSVLALAGVAAAPEAVARALFEGPASLPQATLALVTAVADTIIPTTDTPGAAQAGVPAMFDRLLANWASAEQRSQLLSALQAIEAQARQAANASFAALSAAQRFELLSAFDKAHGAQPDYALLKNLLVTLYYLSEVGSTVELRYEHAPGAWEPSIPVTKDTRTYGGPAAA